MRCPAATDRQKTELTMTVIEAPREPQRQHADRRGGQTANEQNTLRSTLHRQIPPRMWRPETSRRSPRNPHGSQQRSLVSAPRVGWFNAGAGFAAGYRGGARAAPGPGAAVGQAQLWNASDVIAIGAHAYAFQFDALIAYCPSTA